MTSSDYDAVSDSATCRTCGARADWHDETTGACPDDPEFPHPDSMAAEDEPICDGATRIDDPCPVHGWEDEQCRLAQSRMQVGAYGVAIDAAMAEHASREIDSPSS